MNAPQGSPTRLIFVGGHESNDGADLGYLTEAFPGSVVTVAGRPLHNAITTALTHTDGNVIVVPMTYGRNPTFVADAAKTLTWLSAGTAAGRLALSDSFGTIDHLTAWLRQAATVTRAAQPDAALILAAVKSNPFDDAELYRIAHLVSVHGSAVEVDVACVEADAGVLPVIQRQRLLGYPESVVVPAGFARSSAAPFGEGEWAGASFYGPLMSEEGVARIIRERITAAEHALRYGRNGIEDGLMADHGHGYAHSHAFDESQGHGHSHGPGGHTHSHGAGHSHAHGDDHAHTHTADAADTALAHTH